MMKLAFLIFALCSAALVRNDRDALIVHFLDSLHIDRDHMHIVTRILDNEAADRDSSAVLSDRTSTAMLQSALTYGPRIDVDKHHDAANFVAALVSAGAYPVAAFGVDGLTAIISRWEDSPVLESITASIYSTIHSRDDCMRWPNATVLILEAASDRLWNTAAAYASMPCHVEVDIINAMTVSWPDAHKMYEVLAGRLGDEELQSSVKSVWIDDRVAAAYIDELARRGLDVTSCLEYRDAALPSISSRVSLNSSPMERVKALADGLADASSIDEAIEMLRPSLETAMSGMGHGFMITELVSACRAKNNAEMLYRIMTLDNTFLRMYALAMRSLILFERWDDLEFLLKTDMSCDLLRTGWNDNNSSHGGALVAYAIAVGGMPEDMIDRIIASDSAWSAFVLTAVRVFEILNGYIDDANTLFMTVYLVAHLTNIRLPCSLRANDDKLKAFSVVLAAEIVGGEFGAVILERALCIPESTVNIALVVGFAARHGCPNVFRLLARIADNGRRHMRSYFRLRLFPQLLPLFHCYEPEVCQAIVEYGQIRVRLNSEQ